MMKLEFEDRDYLRGHVLVVVHDAYGRSRVHYEDPNVVVDNGRIHIAKLLAGESTDVIDAMVVGNKGSQPPNNISASAPSKTDTSLIGRIGATPFLPGQNASDADATQTVSIVRSLNSVRYDATFAADDITHGAYSDFDASGGGANLGLNAIFISELGLIISTLSDLLMARVTFSPISFQQGSSTSISVQWTLTII